MTPILSRRALRTASLLALVAALLLVVGAHAVQPAGADTADGGLAATALADGVDTAGSHLPSPLEPPDSEDASPVHSEHLTTLVLGLFLVSITLLSGAGLVGRGSGRLLERLRLPSVIPLAPAREPLSLLEVFRL